jgi:hypothetical protein
VLEHHLRYRTSAKGIAPRPIRMDVPGWAGIANKMEPGAAPQPWHCNPFVEGSTHGLELLYPMDQDCQVISDDAGKTRIAWEYAREGNGVTGGEVVVFAPGFYLLNTMLDLRAPAGYALRTEPHPRFFTDTTGTVPLALIGHLQTEWWPKLFFVAFKCPPSGQRHIFRKGEPYAQLILVPRRVSYDLQPMIAAEAEQRRQAEAHFVAAAQHIARNRWHDHTGQTFNDKYKVLSRAFAKGGHEAVQEAVRNAMAALEAALPPDATIERSLELGLEHQKAGRFAEARAIYYHVLERDPENSDALNLLGVTAASCNLPMLAVELIGRAVALRPNDAMYRANLARAWRMAGREDMARQYEP